MHRMKLVRKRVEPFETFPLPVFTWIIVSMSRQAAFDDDDVFAIVDGNGGEEEERNLAEGDRVNGRILVVFETQFGF